MPQNAQKTVFCLAEFPKFSFTRLYYLGKQRLMFSGQKFGSMCVSYQENDERS